MIDAHRRLTHCPVVAAVAKGLAWRTISTPSSIRFRARCGQRNRMGRSTSSIELVRLYRPQCRRGPWIGLADLPSILTTGLACSSAGDPSGGRRGGQHGSAPAAPRWRVSLVPILHDGRWPTPPGRSSSGVEQAPTSTTSRQHGRKEDHRSVADIIPAMIAFLTPAGEIRTSTVMSWNILARRSKN